jgi:hypothetical protein
MDPFLEGYLWPDVHHRLATEIARRLTPRLRPRYVARIEIYVVEDESPEAEIGILYPDVEVVRLKSAAPASPATQGPGQPEPGMGTLAPPLRIARIDPVEVRLAFVEVRDAARNELVTVVEILSPVNKREPRIKKYRERRERLCHAGVHLLEIDLLRRGVRPLAGHPRLPSSSYLITLTRADSSTIGGVWALGLDAPLPAVPVPLRAPDADVPLDLGDALRSVYEEAAYDLSIDYESAPPPPPLTEVERSLVADWVRAAKGKDDRGGRGG